MSRPIPPPPGWFPDPSGAAGMRYWDGVRWTNQRSAPTPPIVINNVVAPMQMYAPPPVYAVSSGPNHAVHLILTLLTCGWWLPVWLIIALVDHRSVSVVHPGARSAPAPQSFAGAHPVLIVFGSIFGLLIVLAFWKVALPLAVVGLVIWGVVVAVQQGQRQAERRRQADSRVATRAEMQHNALMSGDLRVGTFGQFQPADPIYSPAPGYCPPPRYRTVDPVWIEPNSA
jgi:Protein of unknown function (DUF2510)